MISGIALLAQNDSINIINLLKQGGDIAKTIYPNTWIKGIDNTVISGIVTAVASLVLGIIARHKEKKKLRKLGKLND